MTALHCRSAPECAAFIESGYLVAKEWGGGQRDCALTLTLTVTLVLIAIFVGSGVGGDNLVNINTSMCVSSASTLEANREEIWRLTNYTSGGEAADHAVRRMSTAFQLAKQQYEPLGDNSTGNVWPAAYQPSEDEMKELESLANKKCSQPQYCAKLIITWKCWDVPSVPCPDTASTEKLEEISAAHEALNIYGDKYAIPTDITSSAMKELLQQAVDQLQTLVERINFASMLYIFWMVFVLVFAPPVFSMYR